MIELADKAAEKNLKVGVGLMSRHATDMQQLHERVQNGEIGDIFLMRGYRMHGPVGSMASERMPSDQTSELLWQISRFHSFIWASGGCFSDFYIHHVDHLSWMKNAWPIKAQAVGGRHYKNAPGGGPYVDQNFDSYSVEYVFEDGARFIMDGRCINGAESIYSSYIHGTKGSAVVARNGDYGRPSSIHSGQNQDRASMIWRSEVPQELQNPYQNEWNVLIDAIRNDTPHNEVKRGVQASLVTSMGRMAAHTGVEITYDQMLNSNHEYAPGADQFTMGSPPPLVSDENGKYPVPMPGIVTNREYTEFNATA
jgi:predicted dehydrogenase